MPEWLPDVTDDDITDLLDALEAWESKDAAGEMFTDVFEMIMSDKKPEHADAIKASRDESKRKLVRERAVRKERSVILRAKLLTIRNRRRVDQVERESLS